MKSTCLILLFLVFSLNAASCSVAEEESGSAKAPTGRNSNAIPPDPAANNKTPTNSAPSNTAANVALPNTPIADMRKNKMEAIRKGAGNSPANIDLEAELKKSMRPAPENSEFGAVLTDFVFERRTFKNHPQLLKLEKMTRGENKTIKVYLREGKIIEIPGTKIDFISTASSASILQAAGMGSTDSNRKSGSKSLEP